MRVNGDRVVVKAFRFIKQCDILIIWVVSEHDTLGRDVELSHTDTFTSSILKRSDNEKKKRKRKEKREKGYTLMVFFIKGEKLDPRCFTEEKS
jgi:hypothetical protein